MGIACTCIQLLSKPSSLPEFGCRCCCSPSPHPTPDTWIMWRTLCNTAHLRWIPPSVAVVSASSIAARGVASTAGPAVETPGTSEFQRSFQAPHVVLYGYSSCPYCNKVYAWLDYHDIPVTLVELNPLFKREVCHITAYDYTLDTLGIRHIHSYPRHPLCILPSPALPCPPLHASTAVLV